MDTDPQLTFYTDPSRSRRRSRGGCRHGGGRRAVATLALFAVASPGSETFHRQKMETQAQSRLLRAGTGPCSCSELPLFSGGVSQRRMKYILIFLLEASAELWCVLMSDMLQRLARELPCHRSARCCCGFALAPCTYELYVQQRMGTGLVPRQESRPTALHHPFGRFSVPGGRVCVCFPSLSLVCWMVPCFSGSGGTGSHLLQSQGRCWVLGGWFRL